jgi:hypothetical protein
MSKPTDSPSTPYELLFADLVNKTEASIAADQAAFIAQQNTAKAQQALDDAETEAFNTGKVTGGNPEARKASLASLAQQEIGALRVARAESDYRKAQAEQADKRLKLARDLTRLYIARGDDAA